MTFCLLVCEMCGKGTFLQIRSQLMLLLDMLMPSFSITVH